MNETPEEAKVVCYEHKPFLQDFCAVEQARLGKWIQNHECIHKYDLAAGDFLPFGGTMQFYYKIWPGSFNNSHSVVCAKCGEEYDFTHWEHA